MTAARRSSPDLIDSLLREGKPTSSCPPAMPGERHRSLEEMAAELAQPSFPVRELVGRLQEVNWMGRSELEQRASFHGLDEIPGLSKCRDTAVVSIETKRASSAETNQLCACEQIRSLTDADKQILTALRDFGRIASAKEITEATNLARPRVLTRLDRLVGEKRVTVSPSGYEITDLGRASL